MKHSILHPFSTGIRYLGMGISIGMVLLIMALALPVRSQPRALLHQVEGTVTSAGQPLTGVTVQQKGGGPGTVTDAQGHYSLQVPDTATLRVSYIGYETKAVAVNGQTHLDFDLRPSVSTLNQLVVVGYGTQKKLDVTGAVTQVDGAALQDRPVANIGQALQGVVPNLNVTNTGDPGGPGSLPSFNIRGTTSINGGSPFLVVDGVPVDNVSFSSINPADIESVTVLKDAAASAIYGARAPYGVILVTTKKGKKGQKLTVNYSDMFAMTTYTNLPKMVNAIEFAQAYNQASLNSGQSAPFSSTQLEQIRQYMADPGSVPVNVPDPNNPNRWNYATALSNDNVDWFEAYFKPWSFNQTHNLSVSGGSQTTTYFMSLGYYNEGGQLRYGDEVFNRYNITSNLHTEPAQWLRLDLRTRFINRHTDIPYPYAASMGNWIHMATTRWPTWELKEPDGHFSTVSNVAFMKDGGRSITKETDLSITGAAELEPVKNWKINLDYTHSYTPANYSWHNAYVYAWNLDGSKYNIGPSLNSVGEGATFGSDNVFDVYTSYERSFNRHYVKVLLGQQTEVYKYFDVSGEKTDLITDEIPSLSVATGSQYAYDNLYDWATSGTFARINYNFDEKYLLELNARYDGTSKFPPGKRFGLFPSASLGYNVSKEPFWQPLEKFVQNLKLRASYGSLGNQDVANYLYLSTLNVGTNMGYILNGIRPNYLQAPGLVSAGLTWETARTFNLGLDAVLLGDRLSVTFDRYVRRTINMLGPAGSLPATLGTGVPLENNADLRTTGFELSLGWKDRIGKAFQYHLHLVLSDYTATIAHYYNPTKILNNYYVGQKLGDIWGLRTAGLIQTDAQLKNMPDQSYIWGNWTKGDVLYTDLNGDGKVNFGENTLTDHGDLEVIGNNTPRYSYGLTMGFNWKGLDVSLFWQGVLKRDLWLGGWGGNSGNLFWGLTAGFGNNVYKTNLDYWTPEHTDAYWPKPYISAETNKNHEVQSRYLQNGAYTRLKNLQIGYTLPQQWLQRLSLQKVRVFVSGENLLLLSKINKNFDPEVVDGGWGSGKIYPLMKTFSMGLNLTF